MKIYDELTARGLIAQVTDEKEIREYPADRLKFKPRKKKEKVHVNDKELKELEAMEKKEGKSKLNGN